MTAELVRLRAATACPKCGRRHVLDVNQRLVALPEGTYSISGTQPKVVAREEWSYTCTDCGATGAAAAPENARALAGLPVAACGHRVATGHYDGDGHTGGICPGCCPACQRVKG